MEQLELSHTGGRHTNDGEQPLRKTVWQFLTKLNRHLPYDPAIPLLGICPKKMNTFDQIKIYIQMFTAALFIITKNCKESKCPSTVIGYMNCDTSMRWNTIQQSGYTHG